MQKKHIYLSAFFSLALSFLRTASVALAEITNPSAGVWGKGASFAKDGTMTTALFVMMWNSIMIMGGLLVLYNFILAAVEWITSEGEKAKIQKARDKMLHAFIGMLILVTSYTILDYAGALIFQGSFDILSPTLFTPK